MPDRPINPPPIVDSATLFGRCVAVMRKDTGLSQAVFAEQLGISRPALTHIETGRTPPTFYLSNRIARFVGRRRLDGNVTALYALFHRAAEALVAEGFPFRNRPPREGEPILHPASIDRVVGGIYHHEFRELIPVQILQFDGDADDDQAFARVVRFDPNAE